MADSDPKPTQPVTETDTTAPAAREQEVFDAAPEAEGATPAEALAGTGGDGAALDPGQERDLWSGRTSWKHYYGKWALWAVVAVVLLVGAFVLTGNLEGGRPASFYWAAPLVALLFGIVLWAKAAIEIFSIRYRLTSQRLFVERGLLSRTTDQTELVRVDDVRVKQGVVDRIVNSGDVEILSTDISDKALVLVGVEAPDKIAEHVRQHMRTLRKKSLFVENL